MPTEKSGIFEALPDAVLVLDEYLSIQYVNKKATKLFQKDKCILLKSRVEEILPLDELSLRLGSMKENQEEMTFEIFHKALNLWLEIRFSPLDQKTLIFLRDISKRKLEENFLKENLRKFKAIVNNSQAAIYLKDKQGRYIFANNQTAKYINHNLSPQQIIGKTDKELLPEESAHAFYRNDQTVFTLGNTLQSEETITEDGQQKTYLSVKFPLFIGEEESEIICGVSTDITEQKQLERRKDEFISMASHELKTPITSIKLLNEMLLQTFAKRQDHESLYILGKMNDQINNLTRLISDLLDISKINQGKLEFDKEWFDLICLIEEVVENFQLVSKKHKITISGQSKIMVYADKNRLGQVLINLLSNAIKYSPNANEIFIEIHSDNGQTVRVDVKDFGIGISNEHQEKIFMRFYRVMGVNERTFPGLGIGLHIASEIVKQHSGKMFVESSLGNGSTFSFEIPLSGD